MRSRLMSLVLVVILILGSSMSAWAAEEDVLGNELEGAIQENVNLLDDNDVPEAKNETADTQENIDKEENTEEQAIITERNSKAEVFSEIDANGLKWEVEDGVLRISGNGVIERNASFTNNDKLRESITSIIIGEGITEIGVNVFVNFTALLEVVIPNSVTKIEGGAFGGCRGLIKVIIPDSVKSIGEAAFYLSGLKTIVFQGDAPEIIFSGVEIGPFNSVTATVYYPLGNRTYTEELKKGYEGRLTWKAIEPLEIILETTKNTHILGTSDTATITCNGELKNFVNIFVDGIEVNNSNYILEEGSTILTFTAQYLNTLSVGRRAVTLNYTYGSVDTELIILSPESIVNATGSADASGETGASTNSMSSAGVSGRMETSTNPTAVRTGDNAAVLPWLLTALVSASVSIGTVFVRRKCSILFFIQARR